MAPLCDEEQFQASLPPAWQHQQQKSSPFWIRNHILIPKLVPEVKGRSRALIGQSRVTCSLTEPMRSHAHPASWTDYAECSSKKMQVRYQKKREWAPGRENSRAMAPTLFKAAAVQAPPESSPLAWRLSLEPLRLTAGHSPTQRGPATPTSSHRASSISQLPCSVSWVQT